MMGDTDTTLAATLEAVLFAAGRPLSSRQLANLTDAKPSAVETALEQLDAQLKEQRRGVRLMLHDGKALLVSNPEYGKVVEQFIKDEFTGPLSRAALETLAIIAYRGPIAKPAIDTIRGVNSAIMLRTLLIRGLVDRRRDRSDARTFAYALSFDFLRHLGVARLDALPRYAELHANQVIERLAQGATSASMDAQQTEQ